jgi:phospholipase/carboxylesterase
MLNTISRGADDAEVTLVLCHGFGADASDLASLADAFAPATPMRFLFPNAPHAFPRGWGSGRAWFPQDPQEMVQFATGELFRKLAMLDPPGLESSAKVLAQTLREEARGSQLILGGFSQGAMIACEAVLTAGVRPDALLLLSGALIAEKRWKRFLTADVTPVRGMPVLQTHGTLDPVLPYDEGVALAEMLRDGGADHTFLQFDGGHGIPPGFLSRISEWVDAVVTQAR